LTKATHLTDGEGELPSRNNGSSNSSRRDLGQVHRDGGRNDTDTHSQDQSSDDEQGDASDDDQLKDTSDGDDEDSSSQSTLSAEVVTDESGQDGSNEFSSLDDGGEEGGVGGREGVSAIWLEVTEIAQESLHDQDTGEVGTIVTVKEGSHDENGTESDSSTVGLVPSVDG
jgi:hypothetical protein